MMPPHTTARAAGDARDTHPAPAPARAAVSHTTRAKQLSAVTLAAWFLVALAHSSSGGAPTHDARPHALALIISTAADSLLYSTSLLTLVSLGYWNAASRTDAGPAIVILTQILNTVFAAAAVFCLVMLMMSGII